MRYVRLLLLLLLSGAVAAIVGGFLTVFLISLILLGPAGLLVGLPAAGLGTIISIRIAGLPAVLLGGLLWCLGIRRKAVWAATGAVAGLGLFLILRAYPGLDQGASFVIGPDTLYLAPVFALAGVPAALAFRLLMDSFTAFDEGPDAD